MRSIFCASICLVLCGIVYSKNLFDDLDEGKKLKENLTLIHDKTNDKRHDIQHQTVTHHHLKPTAHIKKNNIGDNQNDISTLTSSKRNLECKNFTKDENVKNVKKADVFLIDSSKIGEDGVISPITAQHHNNVGAIVSPDDVDVIAYKKGSISSTSDAQLPSVDGSNPDTVEQGLSIKSNEENGNVLSMPNDSFKSLDAVALQSNIPAEIEYLKGVKSSKQTALHEGENAAADPIVGYSNSPLTQENIPVEENTAVAGSVVTDSKSSLVQENISTGEETALPGSIVADPKSSLAQENIPTEEETAASQKVVDSLLEPVETTGKFSSKNLVNTADAVQPDAGVSKALSADNIIDNSIRDAIKTQLKQDNELATGKAKIEGHRNAESEGIPEEELDKNRIDLKNKTFVGDIAKVAEVVDKAALNRPKTRHLLKHNAKTKPRLQKKKIIHRKQKFHSLTSKNHDLSARVSSLSRSEQNLISSIDQAVRKKDTANELARIMMPVKTEEYTEQTIAPSEQLLDMLSNGKFKEPLPESVLDKLASFDPNEAAAVQSFNPAKSRTPGFMTVSSEVLPVRRIAVDSLKTTQKPLINAKELAKAQQLMETNPYYLAQNNMLLDAKKYHSLQDLSNIGESVFTNNVIDLKQPMLFSDVNAANDETAGINAGNTGGSIFADIGSTRHGISSKGSANVGFTQTATGQITGSVLDSSINSFMKGGSSSTNVGGLSSNILSDKFSGLNVGSIRSPEEVTGGVQPIILSQHVNGFVAPHRICKNCLFGHHRPMFSPISHINPPKIRNHHLESHFVDNDIDPLVMKQINEMPTVNMKDLLKMHRKNHHRINSFKEAVSDTSYHGNTEDEYVPEHMVRLPEERINHGYSICKHGPCLNGGTCTAHPDKYYCSCLPGWIGSNCERRNNCSPNPCHYGTCSPNIDGFTCTCKLGFKGNLCNVLDRCHPNPCHSNGVCTETNRGVQCECAPGFKGKLCELESKCDPINPCLNGGVCREFLDHYRCSCAESFKGQNCEEYVSPTRPPPTIPFKQVGPQVIPAPVNAPNSDIHDIYTFHAFDNFGAPFSSVHEEIRKGSQGSVNPGASLVPHPIIMKGTYSEPGHPFIGAPTLSSHSEVIVHQSDEQDDKSTTALLPSIDENAVSKLPESTRDDRYQTHVVQVTKDEKGKSIKHPPYNHNYHVGAAMSMEYAPSNPSPSSDAEVDKVIKENDQHREEAKVNGHDHHHEERITNEKHKPHNRFDHHNLNLPEGGRLVEENSQNIVVEEQASERSKLLKGPPRELTGTVRSLANKSHDRVSDSKSSEEEEAKKNIKTIADLLKMFDKATKTLSSKLIKNANKFMVLRGKQPFSPKAAEIGESAARNEQPSVSAVNKPSPNFIPEKGADTSTEQITKYIQNIYNLTNAINYNLVRSATVLGEKKDELVRQETYKNFTNHQKNAYKTWRRQALINFHIRNPEKPIPRNTVSLSNNSLCPKFCRLFCDPWCVKIGCCKLSKEKLNMYKEIEKEHERQNKAVRKEEKSNTNDSLTDEAKHILKNLTSTTQQNPSSGSNRSFKVCDKCNENADCVNRRCKCKQGFNGDGETCTVDTCLLCHANAECQSERCFCKVGYYGDGYQCNSIATKRHLCSRCHKMAECVSGNCVCTTGFYGNGKDCWPIPIL